MAAGWLQLKFQTTNGCRAWVVSGAHEVTSDCATFSEFAKRLDEMERDIAALRKKAQKEFERHQGPALPRA